MGLAARFCCGGCWGVDCCVLSLHRVIVAQHILCGVCGRYVGRSSARFGCSGGLSLWRGANFAGRGSRFRGPVRESGSGVRPRYGAVQILPVSIRDFVGRDREKKAKAKGQGKERKRKGSLLGQEGVCNSSAISYRNSRNRLARELHGTI